MRENSRFLDSEERIFTFNDVVQFFKSHRKKWIRFAVIGAVCFFFFFSILPIQYQVDATFKEGTEKTGMENSWKELFGGGMNLSQPMVIVLMKSNQVLKPLSKKLGLQASIGNSDWKVGKAIGRIRDNLKIEWGATLKDPDPFVFMDVSYDGEQPISYPIRFKDRDHFEVFGADRKSPLANGTLRQPVSLPEVEFTLIKTPQNLKMGTFYSLKVVPWFSVANSIAKHLKIASHKQCKAIYELSFSHRDRNYGARVLNELMKQYQQYLKDDHNELAKNQLSYLELRQEQLYEKISRTLDEHVAYLSESVQEDGFIGIEQAKDTLFMPYHQMLARTFEIDLELSHLNQMETGERTIPLKINEPFDEGYSKLQELKQQRDLLEISLQRRKFLATEDNQIDARRAELKQIRDEKEAVGKLIEGLGEKQEISSFGLNHMLYDWALSLQESKNSDEKEDLCEYLENFSRLLSLREKMLQERFFYSSGIPTELEGIDLNTANKLFVEYNNRLDESEVAKRHYEQFREEVLCKNVELGSLSSVLTDPLSQNLIASANKIALQLKEEKYYSSKEGDRWEEELALQRKILSDHLGQLEQVEALNIELIREKISGLQQASLDCINQQISVLYETFADTIKERRTALTIEKNALAQKMEEIRFLIKDLPEKWRWEKWLEMKSDMGQKMIETLTQLVETKTIGHHLFQVESKPLDEAIAPLLPKHPHLCSKTLLGAFCFSFGAFFISLIRKILTGFPASIEKLQALRFPVLGTFSDFCDGPNTDPLTGPDLDLLRKVSFFLEKEPGKVVALIEGQGPDYSYALGENLARVSCKSIVLRCDFNAKFKDEDLPGLLQVCNREIVELPIRKIRNGGDFMTSGGYTAYGTEVIRSPAFAQLIESLKKNYDYIFILLRSPLAFAESISALALCDKAIVTVCKEQTEQLTPFADWAYDKDRCRLNFVVSN